MIIGNGTLLWITHVGTNYFRNETRRFSLHNVLVVPRMKKILLSVTQSTRVYPCYFELVAYGFSIKDFGTYQVLMKGTYHQGLHTNKDLHLLHFFFLL